MVCCCSNSVCEKYGCQAWAKIQPPPGYCEPIASRAPHKCPVCNGVGAVCSKEINRCNACNGTGIVWG